MPWYTLQGTKSLKVAWDGVKSRPKSFFAIGPEMRIIAMAPLPWAVAWATMVPFVVVEAVMTGKGSPAVGLFFSV